MNTNLLSSTGLMLYMYTFIIDVTKDKTPDMKEITDKIQKIMGEPRNYGMCHV